MASNLCFKATIRLGNAAMLTCDDLAAALHEMAAAVSSGAPDGKVHDANGNLVGEWRARFPASEDD